MSDGAQVVIYIFIAFLSAFLSILMWGFIESTVRSWQAKKQKHLNDTETLNIPVQHIPEVVELIEITLEHVGATPNVAYALNEWCERMRAKYL